MQLVFFILFLYINEQKTKIVWIIINFYCNLDFGTKHREGWQRLNNEDTESGILSGTK